ncbi:MAG: hypothetical protein K8R23_01805 [Chthoniobacter sp.]|nr:hypothetical protein [Chthoniobacter sp.]
MRRIRRKPLPQPAARKLRAEQTNANTKHAAKTLDVEKEWKRARRNQPLNTALETLLKMAGDRERCMYCGDSQGTDIEHFWPKSPYSKKMFRWSNLLLGCTACGRDYKGSKFPLDAAKKPLLLDPTSADDPWLHLDFDPQTGNFAPRYDAHKIPAPKGKATVDTLHLDKRESFASGHQKAYKRISDRIMDAANLPAPDAAALISGLKTDDEYGLLGWCFRGAGINEPPMSDLRQAHPAVWADCVTAFKNY